MSTIDKLRSPLVIEHDHGPTCDGPNGDCSKVIIGRAAADPLIMLKLQADDARRNGNAAEERRLRAEFNRGLAAAQAAARAAAQPIQDRGDRAMGCQCNQKRDALERERAARQKMIVDGANAYRTPAIDADEGHDHADAQPTAPTTTTQTATARELAAKAANAKWSRDAHKTGRA
jgi:hypothetical protein